jgi:hypothetical protein
LRRRALDCRSGGEVVLHTDVVILKKYLYVTIISMGVGRIGGEWKLERCSALVWWLRTILIL